MRFQIIVIQHRIVAEEWHVDADNQEEAIRLHNESCSEFNEEETIDVTEERISEMGTWTIPTGHLR